MPKGLFRTQQTDHQHFVTFSCWHRRLNLDSAAARDVFERSLEKMRAKYGFLVIGYVVMPEHIHLLLSEPSSGALADAIHLLKLSSAKQRQSTVDGGHFWQKRYYDFNVRDYEQFAEKLRYIHRNPVKRGLCERPEDWEWSGFGHYATGAEGPRMEPRCCAGRPA